MNVLLIGSGGREHALAWKLFQSHLLTTLYIAPGNPGTAEIGVNIDIDPLDFEKVKEIVISKNIGLVVVGPEDPLVNGIHDFFLNDDFIKHIPVIGPTKAGAMLEGSKDFAKGFMVRHGIPTAAYKSFTSKDRAAADQFLETLTPPYVLKADGLAAGKGVVISSNLEEAKESLNGFFSGKYGKAGDTVVIEEFLSGIELSVFVLTDGKSYVILPEAKDYKRIGEGDTGPNTGGMGSVSPVPFADTEFMKKVEEMVVKPTVNGLKADGIPYVGFIFAGLMNVNGIPYVIEYNARMGDPETQVVMPRIKSDFLELLILTAKGDLSKAKVDFTDDVATAVILVSGGYPADYQKGLTINKLCTPPDTLIFHAGTKKLADGRLVTSGGRVFAAVGLSNSIYDSLERSYNGAECIHFDGKYFRKDIGQDLMKFKKENLKEACFSNFLNVRFLMSFQQLS
jgi:phosphoribosylamine--glycine ligase